MNPVMLKIIQPFPSSVRDFSYVSKTVLFPDFEIESFFYGLGFI